MIHVASARRRGTPLLLTLALMLAIAISAFHAAEAPAATSAQAIAWLNAQREANGIPGAIVGNPAWDSGCADHVRWLALNPDTTTPHEETPGTPGYTLEGALAGKSSVLGGDWTASGAYPWGAANPWEMAPIHLMQLLAPDLSMTGYAPGCMFTWPGYQRAPPPAPRLLTYPGDGTTFAYARQTAAEAPFVPGDFVGLSAGTVTGPHLHVLAWGASPGRITGASLTGPGGPVELRTVDNATRTSTANLGMFLPPGGILIPVNPLAPGALYTASAAFAAVGAPPLSITWRFATAGAPVTAASTLGTASTIATAGTNTTAGATTNRLSVAVRRSRGAARRRHSKRKRRAMLLITSSAPNAKLRLTGPRRRRLAVPLARRVATAGGWRMEYKPMLARGRWTACATSGGGSTGFNTLTRCRIFRI